MDFSRAEAALIASNGIETSISFLRTGRLTELPRNRNRCGIGRARKLGRFPGERKQVADVEDDGGLGKPKLAAEEPLHIDRRPGEATIYLHEG